MASPPPSPPPEPDDSIGCKCGSRLDDKGLVSRVPRVRGRARARARGCNGLDNVAGLRGFFASADPLVRQMLLCEGCEQWSHAKCYRIRKGAVPDSFYCDSCRPPAVRCPFCWSSSSHLSQTSIVFDDVRDVALRARLESDRDSFGFVPSTLRKRKSKASLEVHLTYEERMALEAYWMLYARAEREVPLFGCGWWGVVASHPL